MPEPVDPATGESAPQPQVDELAPPPVGAPAPSEPAIDVAVEPPPIVVDHPENAPKPPKRRQHRRHGLNARAQGILMGRRDTRSDDAGMGGFGASYRFRPVPPFALDAGLDLLFGRDFEGRVRQEAALTVNGLVFFNPQHRAQAYALFGLGFTSAEVAQRPDGNPLTREGDRDYSYFGVQSGIGLDFVVSRQVSLNADLIGFIRGRTDVDSSREPEFVDGTTGRTSNTSGGGLVRAGVTFYFR